MNAKAASQTDHEPGVLHLLAVKPDPGAGPDELAIFGWRDGALVRMYRRVADALGPDVEVVCGPELRAQANAAGVACREAPRAVREARAIVAALAAWCELLERAPPPQVVRALFDGAAELHASFPDGCAALAGTVPGVKQVVLPQRLPDGRLGFSVFTPNAFRTHHRLLAAGRAHDARAIPHMVLGVWANHPVMGEPLAAAGWPVAPMPIALRDREVRRLTPDDLLLLAATARKLARVPVGPAVEFEAWMATPRSSRRRGRT